MIIRSVTLEDLPAVLALVPRLAGAGTPPGRDRDVVMARDLQAIEEAVRHLPEDEQFLLAIDDVSKHLLGFIHAVTVVDYYTQERIGHVSDVAIAESAEGKGVGKALMNAAERWARDRGYALMQLHVVVENTRARAVYERLGYSAEWMKYVKRIE